MSNDWMRMIRGGESLTIEFKVRAPKLTRLSKSFSAFSNSAGGTMFFGIDDEGHLVGLDHGKGTLDLVHQVAQFHCDPLIEIQTHWWKPVPGTDILVVEIPESAAKPVYAINPHQPKDAWPYFRSDKENLPLDKKSMKTMRRTLSVDLEDDWDQLDRHSLNILQILHDKPRRTLNQCAKSVNISSQRAKKLLVELERNGWVHSFFNEKRREYSLAVPWRKK